MSSKATGSDTTLRRRLRVLERAQSLSTLNTKATDLPKILPLEMKHKTNREEQAPSSPTDYESLSDSSDDEREHSSNEEAEGPENEAKGRESPPPSRPTVHTRNLPRRSPQKERSPMSPKSRAWYEFDLAVVVALVSPIGNWLTGGDHIKHLLLIALLIFYLHKIIEVPWILYHKARPRYKAFHLHLADPSTPEGRYAILAASELHKWELFYLFLAFLSPFLGASLLRYVTAVVLGPDAISWFSAGLFVLATGVRPWAHIIDRLHQRTEELHDFVHFTSTSYATEDRTAQLENQVAQLEKTLNKMRSKIIHVTDDIYDYMDDTVEAVEKAMLKHDRKWDRCEGKVREVEQAVGQLQSGRAYHFLSSNIRAYLQPILQYIFSVLPLAPKSRYPAVKSSTPAIRSPSTSQLDTIVEEEDISEMERYPVLARPYSLTSSLVYRVGQVAILPLRAVGRMVLGSY